MQCYTCSIWVHLKCSLLFFFRFKTLGSSHSWSCRPCCVHASSGDPNLSTVCLPLRILPASIPPLFNLAHLALPLLMQHSPPTLAFKHFTLLSPTFYFLTLHPPHPLMFLVVFLYLLFPLPPDWFRIFQRNVGELRARSTKLLHFISSHLVDLIFIQLSSLNSSSSFQIPQFSAVRSDHVNCSLPLAFSLPMTRS